MGNVGGDVIASWIQLVHGSAALYVSFLYVAGLYFAAMVYWNIKAHGKAGGMSTKQPPNPTTTIALAFASGMALYLGGWIDTLDATVFSGVMSSPTDDPLSWRINDAVSAGGSHEELMRLFLKSVVKLFGLIGIGNSISTITTLGTQREKEGAKKQAFLFAVAGIALFRIENTTQLIAEIIPMLEGVANLLQ
jgi:hypothetical protein